MTARGAHSLALGTPPQDQQQCRPFQRGPEGRDVLEDRREAFGLRLLPRKQTARTGERGGDLECRGHRPVPRALVLSQAAVFTGHSEIKMTTSCHGKQAAETGSANGEEKPLSLDEGGYAVVCTLIVPERSRANWSHGFAFLGIF